MLDRDDRQAPTTATSVGTGNTAVFVANSDWYLFNFRANLIQDAEARGWSVVLICTDGPYTEQLQAQGRRVITLPLESAGANPFREADAAYRLARVLHRLRPRVVHLFTLKCVLYGCLAAPVVPNARFIGALTGMGYLFTARSLRARGLKQVVMLGLHAALRASRAELIFQNEQDRSEFVDARLVPRHRTHVIRGSGVDCARFESRPRQNGDRVPRLLYCGRLIAEKGIRDYLTATATLRDAGWQFESQIAGEPYPGNPSSLTANEVRELAADPSHVYLGHYNDMPGLLGETDIVVLPTYYREGTPKILLEAAAAGCIIVTTTIPACEDIVAPDESGYYVSPRAPEQITAALKRILAMTPEERRGMHAKAREIAETRFSDAEVNRRTLALYPQLKR